MKKAPAKGTRNATPVEHFAPTFRGQFEKWALPFVFVVIGAIMVWTLIRGFR